MIQHIVLLDLPDGYGADELADIMDGLAALGSEIAGFNGFVHGVNRDFESMSPDCAYGFICQFADQETSMAYLQNAKHQALGARLVGLCRGGVQGITVIDLSVGP